MNQLSKEKCFYTYELVDPRNSKVFYVGKGSLKYGKTARLRDHIAKARKGCKGMRYTIIRELLAEGLEPQSRRVLSEVTELEAYAEENRLIQEYGLCNLTNAKSGGQGGPCGPGELLHWTKRHPEKLLRGKDHPLVKDPSKCARGLNNGSYTHPEMRRRGESHGCSKLTEAQVDEIRDAYLRNIENTVQLSKRFDVTVAQICNILHGKSWNKPPIKVRPGNQKLTKEQKLEIKNLYSAEEISYTTLAKRYKVSKSLIALVVSTIDVDIVSP